MAQRAVFGVLLLSLEALQVGCIVCSDENPWACMEAFNNCAEDPGALLGSTTIELDLRKSVVRTQEAPAGNLAADGLMFTANQLCARNGLPCPVAAVVNGGGIRSETTCGERERIPEGFLYERDIHQMMPFGNSLVVTTISGHDLKLALEHSVDELGKSGTAGQSGHFLQVSHLKLEVDCAQPAQALDINTGKVITEGSRIVDGSLMLQRADDAQGNPVWEAVDVTGTDAVYPIAINDFIGSGRDGFLSLVLRDETNTAVTDADGNYLDYIETNADNERGVRNTQDELMTDAMGVADYVRAQQQVTPYVSGRIILRPSCVAGAVQ